MIWAHRVHNWIPMNRSFFHSIRNAYNVQKYCLQNSRKQNSDALMTSGKNNNNDELLDFQQSSTQYEVWRRTDRTLGRSTVLWEGRKDGCVNTSGELAEVAISHVQMAMIHGNAMQISVLQWIHGLNHQISKGQVSSLAQVKRLRQEVALPTFYLLLIQIYQAYWYPDTWMDV